MKRAVAVVVVYLSLLATASAAPQAQREAEAPKFDVLIDGVIGPKGQWFLSPMFVTDVSISEKNGLVWITDSAGALVGAFGAAKVSLLPSGFMKAAPRQAAKEDPAQTTA